MSVGTPGHNFASFRMPDTTWATKLITVKEMQILRKTILNTFNRWRTKARTSPAEDIWATLLTVASVKCVE